jgi:amidase
MQFPEYDDLDATALAALVNSGEVHPRHLVEAAIERAEARNPMLNAIIHRQFERALADAEAVDTTLAFAGVPFLLKDYKGREAGEPYQMGVRTLRELDYRPRSDSPLALRVRSGGLIPIGRTNVPEMAVMGTTEPEAHGPTHNPWALDRSPGGSSGGSAAAVAARIVPVAHANDISGSIRIPASMCGLVGLKPTRGRVITSAPDAPTGMMVEGVVSRSVRDTAAIVDLLSHSSPWWPAPGATASLRAEVGAPLAPLRIGVWTTAFNASPVEAGCVAAAELAASLLASMGHHVEVGAPAVLSSDELWGVAKQALGVSAAAEASDWTARIGHPLGEADLEPRTWAMVQAGQAVTAVELYHLIERMQELAQAALAWWNDFDVLITPTVAAPASPLGDYLTNYVSGLGSAFTRPINLTGQPAMSVPLGWPDDGLPRGVQLVAAYGRDDLLVRVASALEAAAPWAHRQPAVGR